MALPAAFLDELRARTPLSALIGRRVRLARSGRNWKGNCPFHQEHTPSFYVYDDHFHCFGCGAHGDAVGFVMQTQGLDFREAVDLLAREAGLDVPRPNAEAAAAERRRHDLGSVLTAAATAFQRRLLLPEGARALSYLRGRGLSEETIRRFGLGYAPGRGALTAELGREGIEPSLLVEAGLLRQDDGGGRPFELFFERVMFPIRDRRGAVISFGGRTLGDGQPKYLNGPETALFSKRRTLYGLDLARAAARAGAPVIVAEGYMDVIALHQGGFAGAVAPLGTALTAEQMEELWRLAPEPVLCFDADAAGRAASIRAADAALPMLAPERTLRIAILPEGQDPDALIREQGSAAFQRVLDAASPLADALYGLLRAAAPLASPEQRAAFRARLEAAAARIDDRGLAREYRQALLDRFFAENRRPQGLVAGGRPRAAGGWTQSPAGRPGPLGPKPARPGASRATPTPEEAASERLRLLAAILLHHPSLVGGIEEQWQQIDLPPGLAPLREAVLAWAESRGHEGLALDSAGLIAHLHDIGLGAVSKRVLASSPFPLPVFALPDAVSAEAEAGWWHIFGLLHHDRLDAEIEAAQRDFAEQPDERTQRRLLALAEARERLRQGETDDAGA